MFNHVTTVELLKLETVNINKKRFYVNQMVINIRQ